jgi:hypothetical protein
MRGTTPERIESPHALVDRAKEKTMADVTMGDGLWAFVVIGGFIILGAAIAFAKLRNRTSARTEAFTEAKTRELYKEQSAQDRASTP